MDDQNPIHEDVTGALLRERDKDRATRAREARETRKDEREGRGFAHGGELNSVSINGPHSAQLVNGTLALTINAAPAVAAGAGVAGAIEVVVSGSLNGAYATGTALFSVAPV